MVKAVIFDYGGVFTIKGSFKGLIDELSKETRYSVDEIYEAIRPVWNKVKVDDLDSQEFWKTLETYLDLSADEIREKFLGWFGFRPEMMKLSDSLRGGYRVALLSNHIRDWFEEEKKLRGLDGHFDGIFTSFGLKMAKPQAEAYLAVAHVLDVPIKECIFIDDHPGNVEGAIKAGMRALVFQSTDMLIKDLENLGVNKKFLL